jgi:hypothetical protein
MLRTIVVRAAAAFVLTASAAFGQTQPGAAASNVLPLGGGQALIDTSDTALLLLDHQAVFSKQ